MSSSGLPNGFVDTIRAPLFSTHESGVHLTYEWRVEQLNTLYRMIRDRRQVFVEALAKDLGRYPTESVCAEIIPIETEVQYMLQHLKGWMKPEYVSTPLLMFPARAWIESKPLQPPGVLIVGPFNYPLQLCLKPLAGVLAGGNPCVIKPSEMTPNTAKALHECIREYFDPSVVQVVLGAIPETEALLAQPWAKVLFTGSARVGKIVAEACARTLTPCILECGGKSATVVDETVSVSQIQNVADRIVFAKFFNSGQVCIAPDTLFVHDIHVETLVKALKRSIEAQFGKDPQAGEMARIVGPQSAQRLVDIITELEQDVRHNNSKLLLGGSELSDAQQRYVAPTLVLNPSSSSRVMTEEIFGPILPICSFSHCDEAIKRIQELSNVTGIPLFLYVFTKSNQVFQKFTQKCQSGGAVRNDVLIQLANPELPLGGLGNSGYGRYFGKYSFDAFTHKYPVTYRPLGSIWDFGNLRCHPYQGWKSKLLEDFLLYLPKVPASLPPSRMLLLCLFPIAFVSFQNTVGEHPWSWKSILATQLERAANALRNS
ncbi:aldehyde/histidinol dehydrogenase [Nitzschia inconspicua]|uniref:Aldehyde dehydrogenase n=1 Tax=Nitzschia inconspicua TaxID=303405 RepID=A0A9K3L1U7_9STRA|nr:aldehyde/histidinol dehydrogenase [Nitzschia inconspicua]